MKIFKHIKTGLKLLVVNIVLGAILWGLSLVLIGFGMVLGTNFMIIGAVLYILLSLFLGGLLANKFWRW